MMNRFSMCLRRNATRSATCSLRSCAALPSSRSCSMPSWASVPTGNAPIDAYAFCGWFVFCGFWVFLPVDATRIPLIAMGNCSPLLFASRGRAGAAVRGTLVALFMTFGTPSAGADQGVYRLGVLPLQSPNKLAVMFLPLAEALSERLGRPVQFVTAPSFSAFMTRVSEKNYDILYLNPLLCSRALEHGYHVVAKVGGEPFTGILVVRRDSPLKELDPAQLPPRLRIGFPDPGAYAATVMTRRYLSRLGIDVDRRFQVKFFGSQDSALMALYSGLVDMAGTWGPARRAGPGGGRGGGR